MIAFYFSIITRFYSNNIGHSLPDNIALSHILNGFPERERPYSSAA